MRIFPIRTVGGFEFQGLALIRSERRGPVRFGQQHGRWGTVLVRGKGQPVQGTAPQLIPAVSPLLGDPGASAAARECYNRLAADAGRSEHLVGCCEGEHKKQRQSSACRPFLLLRINGAAAGQIRCHPLAFAAG